MSCHDLTILMIDVGHAMACPYSRLSSISSRQSGREHRQSFLAEEVADGVIRHENLTATGVLTSFDQTRTVFPSILTFAGLNTWSAPAISKQVISLPADLSPLLTLSKVILTLSFSGIH